MAADQSQSPPHPPGHGHDKERLYLLCCMSVPVFIQRWVTNNTTPLVPRHIVESFSILVFQFQDPSPNLGYLNGILEPDKR
jgi:hypothetical protein